MRHWVRCWQYCCLSSGQLSLLLSMGWEISTSQEAVAVLCSQEGNCSLASHWPCITDHMIWAQWPNEGRWALKQHSSICMLKPTVQIACQPNVQDTSPKHLSPKWFDAQTSADHRTHVSFTVTRRLSAKLFGQQMFGHCVLLSYKTDCQKRTNESDALILGNL